MKKEKLETPLAIGKHDIHRTADKDADRKTIENHKQAAAHHKQAAKYNLDAVKHYEGGHYEKASHSSVLAYGHHLLAGEFLNDDAKHHAQTLKETNYQ